MPVPYLYAHPNPHAPVRANGVRFHGYPQRARPARVIVIHDTESVLDVDGVDGGAEAIAAYQSTVARPSSYHRITDADSTVVCLPDEAVAFGVIGLNTPSLHVSMAMRTDAWTSRDPEVMRRRELTLERTAVVVAGWSRAHRIPIVHLSRASAFGAGLGVIGHGAADPTRRSDPGAAFPWDRFLARALALTASHPPAPTIPPAPPAKPDRVLRLDRPTMQGQDVRNVQNALRLAGLLAPDDLDGWFGPDTDEAVRELQHRAGLEVDGIVGPATWAALRKVAHP